MLVSQLSGPVGLAISLSGPAMSKHAAAVVLVPITCWPSLVLIAGDSLAKRAGLLGLRPMKWYHSIAYFFGGMFLTNAVPHLVQGVSGRPMQTPFASPPGQGLSSALVNVLWGMANLLIGYLLVCRVGTFDLRKNRHALPLGLGILTMAIMLARTFAKFYGGQ